MLVNGEDVYSLLQDFTLCPPSQELEIMVITPPLSQSLRRLVDTKGYPEITQPLDKTGRSVLFWVEGYIPTTAQIQSLITRDGRHRGMAWALLDGKDSIQQLDADRKRHDKAEEDEHEDANEPGNDDASETETEAQGKGQIRDYVRRTKIRWTIAFEDENEARRFVRRWHLRPFSEARRGG